MGSPISALSVLRQELPKWWKDPQQEDFRDTLGMFVPQDSVDLALSVAGGPFPKLAKKIALGVGAMGMAGDAEAGTGKGALTLVQKLLRKSPYLAEQAERLFHAAPVTYEAFDPLAIRNALKTNEALRVMKPSEFLASARPMPDTLEDWDKLQYLRKQLAGSNLPAYPFEPPLYDRRTFRGFDELPFLQITKESDFGGKYLPSLDYTARPDIWKVTGHEGRHRMSAIRDTFGNEPVGVEFSAPYSSENLGGIDDLLYSPESAVDASVMKYPRGFAGGGVIPGLTSWLEQKKRQAKRGLSDWLERPQDTAHMVGSRLDEDMTKHLKDPTSALDFVTGPVGGLAGVIKPRGGNWYPGVNSLVTGLKKLRRYAEPGDIGVFEGLLADDIKTIQEYLDAKKIVPETVHPIIDEQIANARGAMARHQGELDSLHGNKAVNDWIEGPLKKYIMRDMASEADPIRKLADEGIIHYRPEIDWSSTAIANRRHTGHPDAGVAQTPLGQSWETTADAFIDPYRTVKRFIKSAELESSRGDANRMTGNEWINKLPDETSLYDMSSPAWDEWLGFGHLADELRNALRSDSGLPVELRLKPADFKQMGIDRAVRHVDKINKWRENNRISADLKNLKDLPVIADYPDTGFKWVELKHPTDDKRTASLLTEEGNAMGHCVGGYCDDVLGNKTRIFSLRDAKGQPHVTVEVADPRSAVADDGVLDFGEGDFADTWVGERYSDYFDDLVAKEGGEPDFNDPRFNELSELAHNMAVKDYTEKFLTPDNPQVVNQIKGKSNARPNRKYIPYVQDLIQNHGPWAEILDFENSGLVRHNGELYDPVKGAMYRMDPTGSYIPNDVFGDYAVLHPSILQEAGFAPEGGVFSIHDLQQWARQNEDQYKNTLRDFWQGLSDDATGSEANQLTNESYRAIVDKDVEKHFFGD